MEGQFGHWVLASKFSGRSFRGSIFFSGSLKCSGVLSAPHSCLAYANLWLFGTFLKFSPALNSNIYYIFIRFQLYLELLTTFLGDILIIFCLFLEIVLIDRKLHQIQIDIQYVLLLYVSGVNLFCQN